MWQRCGRFASICLFLASARALRGQRQQFDFPGVAPESPTELSRLTPDLAKRVLAGYRDDGRPSSLDDLFRLQLVAGRYADALRFLDRLRALPGDASPRSAARELPYRILAEARVMEAKEHVPFDEAFRRAFRTEIGALDDRTSGRVVRAFTVGERFLRQDLDGILARQKGKSEISLADALTLIRAYQIDEAARAFGPLVNSLVDEDDRRRYVLEKDVVVKTPEGAAVCATVLRPRAPAGRLPALLEFTIYADPGQVAREARLTASHGYASVTGFTRGKACGPGRSVPYVHDGADAAAVIDWIAGQSWSDGRVGMYGGSYSGFTPWAAAKHMPKGLKALMVGAPGAPGIDVPMEGNVFWNFVYPWPFYTTDNKTLDDATYGDAARWRRLDHDWYAGGRAYRDLEKIDGTPNPIFDEWIAHPAYDAYWQGMIPYGKEFARINIPVLTTAGYYYGGPGAATYYFREHQKYNPGAEHYLLIGPYDHFGAQRGTSNVLGPDDDVLAGYKLDPVALIDITELRYQWFDYVFKGGARPALLTDRVNYEVTGANVWKHSPGIAAMADRTLRFHLSPERVGDAYRLSERKPADDAFIPQTVDFADRSDVDRRPIGGGVQDKDLDIRNGLEFVSEPFTRATELSGLFSGQLDFIVNKKDFDFQIELYEMTPKDEYVQLAPFWLRASYAGDRGHRRLLTPGRRQRLNFRSARLMSRSIQKGSRLVAVLSVIKEPGRQIDYGTGRDVSSETISDGKEPLRLEWFGDSFLDLPAGK